MHLNAAWKLWRVFSDDPWTRDEIALLRRMALWTFGWMVATEIVIVFEPYPIKWFFDGLVAGRSRIFLMLLCAVMLTAYCLGTVLHGAMEKRRTDFFWKLWAVLWGYGHRRQLALGVDWHIFHSTGDKESILSKNVHRVQALLGNMIFEAIPTTLRILLTSIGVWWLGWHFGTLAAATIVIYAVVLWRNERYNIPLRTLFRTQMKKIERDGSELVRNWRTLKQFGLEEEQCDEHAMLLRAFCQEEHGRFRHFIHRVMRQEYVISVSRAALYATIVWFFTQGESIGSLILATAWMERIYSNFYRFSNFQRYLNEGLGSLKELVSMFEEIPSVRQPENPAWDNAFEGVITFENVSFSYPGTEREAVKNISLTIEPYQCVALVGYSGSGKSTLASLLLREYDPSEGRILIHGIDLKTIDYDRYRRELVSVVSQSTGLFDMTIADNIRVARHQASFAEIKHAAEKSYAAEFIAELPLGYDTEVGEDGVRLSGGQRQRLAIARALLRKPKILIFDEATSSLDAVSQSSIQETIEELIKKRETTIIIIAHRFSTIMKADRVVVLEDGRIKEIGTHTELTEKNGVYRKLQMLEMQGISSE